MENNLVNQLNLNLKTVEQTLETLYNKEKNATSNGNKVIFYSKANFDEALKSVAPYLKVALFCKHKTFLSIGKQYVDKLKCLGNKTVCFVVADDFQFTVSSSCGAFNLAEDVRTVIVLDHDLYSFALYFSTIRKISVIFIADCLYPEIFYAKLYVSNLQTIDNFNLNTERHVVLNDYDKAKIDLYVIAMQFSLSEFCAFNCINGIVDAKLYEFLEKEKGQTNVISLLKLYYYDLLLDGKIFENSSVREFCLLSNKSLSAQTALILISKVVKDLINNSLKEDIDYNKLSKKIQLITGEKLANVISRLNKNLKIIDEKKTVLLYASKNFINEVMDINKLTEGKLTKKTVQKKFNSIYSVCGYSLGINALTLAKEKNFIYKL